MKPSSALSSRTLAAPTFKRGFGYHPLCAFLDHGSDGTGEPLAIQLRPGNAGSNTAADHISVTREALAQLRITDHEGMRITAFATNTTRGQLPALELRHRRRARCEDRIRNTKDMGLLKLPLQSFTQNQIWCQIIQLACDLVAWMQTIAFTSDCQAPGLVEAGLSGSSRFVVMGSIASLA